VSCIPSTSAEDIAVLNPQYKVEYMQLVDIFRRRRMLRLFQLKLKNKSPFKQLVWMGFCQKMKEMQNRGA
jgi:hypothetical protein